MGMFNFFRNTADINTGVAEYEKTDGSVLLDVRTPEEYRDGHIDGSINLRSEERRVGKECRL